MVANGVGLAAEQSGKLKELEEEEPSMRSDLYHQQVLFGRKKILWGGRKAALVSSLTTLLFLVTTVIGLSLGETRTGFSTFRLTSSWLAKLLSASSIVMVARGAGVDATAF